MIHYPQAPRSVIMVRPHHFSANPQTAHDNTFQRKVAPYSATKIAKLAYTQVSQVAALLSEQGVNVHLFEDKTVHTPDSVFPNNWFSCHAGGKIAVYPMYAKNRRLERRNDIIGMLKQQYRVQDIVDYSPLEFDNIFLEGTGAMVLDHIDRVAYVSASKRANSLALERFCSHFNYEPMLFDAANTKGEAVYHTNVMMCIGSEFALIGLDMITDVARKRHIVKRLEASGKEVIALSNEQINAFCANAIELQANNERILALSETAILALTSQQQIRISKSVNLCPLNVSALELAGGSIRCMIAGIHLTKR